MNFIQTLQTALATVPSPDNTQPWEYELADEYQDVEPELLVFHQGRRAAHPLNQSGAGSLLGLGFVLETVAVTARKSGYDVLVNLQTENLRHLFSERRLLVAKVKFAKQTKDETYYPALFQRKTNRGAYRLGRLPQNVREKISIPHVHLQSQKRFSMFRYLYRTEVRSWTRPEIICSIFQWIRTPDENRIERLGLNIKGLGLSTMEERLMLFFRARMNWLRRLAPLLGLFGLIQPLARQSVFSAAFGCVTAADRSPMALVQAGRLAMRTWLELTLHGYDFHPHCAGSLKVHAAQDATAEKMLRGIFGLENSEIPVLIFRTGIGKKMQDSQRSLKRPVEIARHDHSRQRNRRETPSAVVSNATVDGSITE